MNTYLLTYLLSTKQTVMCFVCVCLPLAPLLMSKHALFIDMISQYIESSQLVLQKHGARTLSSLYI